MSVIVGAAAVPVRRKLERSIRDTAVEVAFAATADAGIDLSEVDALFVSPPGLSGPPGFMFSCTLAHHLGITTRAQTLLECGGMTAALTLKLAVDSIRLGRCRCALIVAMDVRRDPSSDFEHFIKNSIVSLIGLYGPYDGVYGLGAPIPYYAMSAQRYLYEYHLSERDLAEVAVVLRAFASKNPLAEHTSPITVDDVLASRPVCPPLKLLDCSSFASGAVALVVADSPRGDKRPIAVTGIGEHHEPSHFASLRGPLTSFPSATKAAHAALAEAERRHDDIDVAEVYGVFSATELMLYEDLGFFEKGKAARAVREGRTRGEGRTLFSPSGGRLSLGHPAGATPLYAAVELVEQLRTKSDIALLHAEHGMLNGSLVAILEGR